MGGFSFGKIVLLVLVVAAVWYAFKYANRIDEIHRMMKRRQRTMAPPQPLQAEDLVKCRACGSYVASASATGCGRPDCPWRR